MKEIQLPPPYRSGICRNAMNEVCVENCTLKKDMSAFELKKGIGLSDLPPFPLDEFVKAMTGDERKIIMAVYMAKTVDFLQGRKETDGQILSSIRRPPLNSQRTEKDSTPIPSQDLLTLSDERVDAHQDRGQDTGENLSGREVLAGENDRGAD